MTTRLVMLPAMRAGCGRSASIPRACSTRGDEGQSGDTQQQLADPTRVLARLDRQDQQQDERRVLDEIGMGTHPSGK